MHFQKLLEQIDDKQFLCEINITEEILKKNPKQCVSVKTKQRWKILVLK